MAFADAAAVSTPGRAFWTGRMTRSMIGSGCAPMPTVTYPSRTSAPALTRCTPLRMREILDGEMKMFSRGWSLAIGLNKSKAKAVFATANLAASCAETVVADNPIKPDKRRGKILWRSVIPSFMAVPLEVEISRQRRQFLIILYFTARKIYSLRIASMTITLFIPCRH